MTLSKTFSLLFFIASSLLWAACGKPSTDGDAVVAASATEPVEASAASGESEPVEEAEPAKWLTNHEQALALAGEQGRVILVNFTGSDWCPPCIMLKRDIFETAAFRDYAAENLVLLEIDFPFGYQQEAELVKQNEGLQLIFKIESFPTLILIDAQGEEKKRMIGYIEGGPSAFIRWVES